MPEPTVTLPRSGRPAGMIEGMPASAGRATGVARVLLDLADGGAGLVEIHD